MNVDLNACINGSKAGWDQFVDSCSGLIYAAVRRAYRNRSISQQEIEDRVQDVFVQLLQKDCKLLRAFDPQRASLSTYLTLIARSVTYQHTQRKRLDTASIMDVDVPVGGEPTANGALEGLQALTERQQIVIQLLFEHGLTVEEAAHRLGVDPQTIRSTKHKALTRLRQQAD